MILLTSNGLSSERLLERVKELVPGGGRAALVTTASVGFKETDRHVPRLAAELESLGLAVELFDFDEQPPAALMDYPVAELMGGNPFYLLDAIRKKGFEDPLRQIAREGLLIGISAGAAVLQRDIALIAGYSPELNDGVGLTDLTGLGLTQGEVLPHYSRFLTRFDRFEERAAEYQRRTGRTVLRINDGEAVLDTGGGRLEILGK